MNPSSSAVSSLAETNSTTASSSQSPYGFSNSEQVDVEETESSGSQVIYRLDSPDTGKHFYRNDANERKVLYEQRGRRYLGNRLS